MEEVNLNLKPLCTEDLTVFKELLGSPEFGGCFCAVWTSADNTWASRCSDPKQPNFDITAKDLQNGRQVGFLVYDKAELIGWTGSGPKTSFPLLEGKLGSRLSDFSDSIWSVGCIAIKEKFRGKKLSEKVVQSVIAEARKNGAKSIESYPVRPFHEPRIYRGSMKMFERLNFVEVGFEKDGEYDILLMQLNLEE